jgi:hypothetical protein
MLGNHVIASVDAQKPIDGQILIDVRPVGDTSKCARSSAVALAMRDECSARVDLVAGTVYVESQYRA